jgi:hypothetical protein
MNWPEWVDGEKFVEWIEEVRPNHMEELSESQHRTLWRFRQSGVKGSLETVDHICCALFLHINEIPEEVWTDEAPNKGRRIDGAKKLEALELVESGVSISQAAKQAGVHPETLRYWFYASRKAA